MTNPEVVPGVGSQVSRYTLAREIGRGPLGPLYECLKEGSEPPVSMLARVVPLPEEIREDESKEFSEAAWDSAITSHALSVRVADVLFGNGWVTLIHDGVDGLLLPALEAKCASISVSLPAEIAARIVLDVLEGLELSHAQCTEVKLKWRAGSVSPSSLYLCRDGRTRTLDGQVTAALLRISATAEGHAWGPIPPELSQPGSFVDERSDVYLVGALLWRLLVGRDFQPAEDNLDGSADLATATPAGKKSFHGVGQVLRRALRREPAERQGSLRELSVALVMGAEKVATYPEVASYVETLHILDSSRDGSPVESPNLPVVGAIADDRKASSADSTVAEGGEDAAAGAHLDPPHAVVGSEPNQLKDSGSKARLSMISWADDGMPRVGERLPTHSAQPQAALPICATEPQCRVEGSGPPGIAADSNARTPDLPKLSTGQSEEFAERGIVEETTVPSVESDELRAAQAPSGGKSASPDELKADISSPKASKPLVTRAALSSSRPPRNDRQAGPSDAVKEVLSVLEKKSTPKAPLNETENAAESLPPKRQLQISVTTLVLGFSTTVLAVIVVMLLVLYQRPKGAENASPSSPEPGVSTHAESQPDSPTLPVSRMNTQRRADVDPASASADADAGVLAKEPKAVVNVPAAAKRPAAKSGKAPSSADGEDESEASTTQKRPKNYIPNEL